MTQKEFALAQRVYIEDTDAGGIVYYVNYLKFMERARTEFFRQLGFSKPAMLDGGLLMVVASAEIQYKKPARLDDEIILKTTVVKQAKTYLVFLQDIVNNEKQLLCSGKIKVACVKGESMRPNPLPNEVNLALKKWFDNGDSNNER